MRAGRYLIALAGISVLAAGCGTVHAGRSSGTQDTLTAAVSHTAAQTARITITEAIQATGMSMSFTQAGEFDFAHSRGMLTMTAPAEMTELFLPPRVYLKISGAGSTPLLRGKTWLEIDTGNSASLGSALGPFGSGSDPADMLASLTAIAGSERILGTAIVGGVRTTEYQVNIDPAKMAAKVPASERASFGQFVQSLGKGTIPVDVWVDTQNQVRQVRLSLHTPDSALLPGKTRLTETLDFYDFGVAVRVSAPPASQVTNLGGTGDVSIGSVSSASAGASAAPPPPTAMPASVPAMPAMSASAPAVSASPFPAQG